MLRPQLRFANVFFNCSHFVRVIRISACKHDLRFAPIETDASKNAPHPRAGSWCPVLGPLGEDRRFSTKSELFHTATAVNVRSIKARARNLLTSFRGQLSRAVVPA